MTSQLVSEREGQLSRLDLASELDPLVFPLEIHSFLLSLMEKFELCIRLEDESYLVPELLNLQQPEDAEQFESTNCLSFHYLYPILPIGILPRFIARTYVLSDAKKHHRWRTGVILQFEGYEALVKADLPDKTIHVLIKSPPEVPPEGRRRMLTMIRQDFDAIHSDMPHLNPEELVSFPHHPKVTERYRDLEILYKETSQTPIKRVIEGKIVSMSVGQLLGDVEEPTRIFRRPPVSNRRIDRDDRDPLSVFYSYAHADAKQRLKLSKHLAPLERIGLLRTWYDHEILPCAEWEQEISNKLDQANIILLLISPDFVASHYCYTVEFQRAMERREQNCAEVLPIIIRSTHGWTKIPAGKHMLGELNALPPLGLPIPAWKPQDTGWAKVAEGIEKVARALIGLND